MVLVLRVPKQAQPFQGLSFQLSLRTVYLQHWLAICPKCGQYSSLKYSTLVTLHYTTSHHITDMCVDSSSAVLNLRFSRSGRRPAASRVTASCHLGLSAWAKGLRPASWCTSVLLLMMYILHDPICVYIYMCIYILLPETTGLSMFWYLRSCRIFSISRGSSPTAGKNQGARAQGMGAEVWAFAVFNYREGPDNGSRL